jgi:hypothetical protein
MLSYYPPAISLSSLKAAVKDLRPDYIPLSLGYGFTVELSDHTIQPSNANDSPLLCYRISTTPGLPGSPVTMLHVRAIHKRRSDHLMTSVE